MGYYVVNARTARGSITAGTHIMRSNNPKTPGLASDLAADFLYFGSTIKHTLYGRQAGRYVNVFAPAEASCRECRKRWQLAVQQEAAEASRRAALTPEQRSSEDRAKEHRRPCR
jgi:hypothetical protein